ncbi:hypothetical protein FIBSPDRAFT_902752 [Athelia psychrophila]|uniref:Uncharacterized protein n=1 Tax=Athelia psychrophila TaxID=1759441 RepID=A0A167WV09_9AGAM|nr:hypothetical protein FIBSPDRAFT_902752 [Fibularhizoctonia sp. CBS 109695]
MAVKGMPKQGFSQLPLDDLVRQTVIQDLLDPTQHVEQIPGAAEGVDAPGERKPFPRVGAGKPDVLLDGPIDVPRVVEPVECCTPAPCEPILVFRDVVVLAAEDSVKSDEVALEPELVDLPQKFELDVIQYALGVADMLIGVPFHETQWILGAPE